MNKKINNVVLAGANKLEVLNVKGVNSRYFGINIPVSVKGVDVNSGYKYVFPKISYKDVIEMLTHGNIILNNSIIAESVKNGYEIDIINGDETDEYDDYKEIYQYYIIDADAAELLSDWTNEIIYYINELDIYLLGVTHFGTNWGYVSSDIKIYNIDEIDENDADELFHVYDRYKSDNSMYMSELVEWGEILEYLGNKYNRIDELKENGII